MYPQICTAPATLARALLAERRLIARHIDSDLFSDPARDMLLVLLIAAEEKREESVESCAVAARATEGVARRWIAQLVARALVEPVNIRLAESPLRLTPDAHRAMLAYIAAYASGLNAGITP